MGNGFDGGLTARDVELGSILAALATVARAAGVFEATCQAGTVTEVGEIIAAEVTRMRGLLPAIESAREATVTTGGRQADPLMSLVLGEPPWSVSYQLLTRGGQVVFSDRVGPLETLSDKARIEFGPSDLRPVL